MWLFDNIFLDKDTPTALLDQKSTIEADPIEASAEPVWVSITATPSGKQNSILNPPIQNTSSPVSSTPVSVSTVPAWLSNIQVMPVASPIANTPSDITFDIGGDLNFGGSPVPETAETVISANPSEWVVDIKNISIPSTINGGGVVELNPIILNSVSSGSTSQIWLIGTEATEAIPSIALVQSSTAVWGLMIISEWDTKSTPDISSLIIQPSVSEGGIVWSPEISLLPTGSEKTETEKTSEKGWTFIVTWGATTPSGDTSSMDSLFGFSVDTPSGVSEVPTISEVTPSIPVPSIPEEPVIVIHDNDLTHVLVTPTESLIEEKVAPTEWKQDIKIVKDSKINEMIQGFIDELNEHQGQMYQLDELNTLKLKDIKQRKELIRVEYEEKTRQIQFEEDAILWQQAEKQAKSQKLENIIRTLREQCEA